MRKCGEPRRTPVNQWIKECMLFPSSAFNTNTTNKSATTTGELYWEFLIYVSCTSFEIYDMGKHQNPPQCYLNFQSRTSFNARLIVICEAEISWNIEHNSLEKVLSNRNEIYYQRMRLTQRKFSILLCRSGSSIITLNFGAVINSVYLPLFLFLYNALQDFNAKYSILYQNLI